MSTHSFRLGWVTANKYPVVRAAKEIAANSEALGILKNLLMSFSVGRDTSVPVPALHELKNQLQTNDLQKKAEIMECLLTNYRSSTEGILMHVIRYVSGYSKDHTLAKLTNLFWECLPGQDTELTLLISQIIRDELQSTNEYMRGACLRNLAKTCTLEVLKTVADVIVENLHHPHAYVRSSACLCIGALAQKFPGYFEDALPTLIALVSEDHDKCTQRRGIYAIGVLNMATAYQTFILNGSQLRCSAPNPDVYNCGVVDFIRDCWTKTKSFPPPTELIELVDKNALLDELSAILASTASNVVRLSAVKCLLWISSREDHLEQAAYACVAIMTTDANLDVKYHVMQIIEEICKVHSNVIECVALDILRLLGSGRTSTLTTMTPDLVQAILKLSVPVISEGQVKDAVEILQSQLLSRSKNEEIHRMLLKGMRQICARFPNVALSVIDVLLDYLSESESIEVVALLRELIVCSAIDARARESIIQKLISSIMEVKQADVLCQGIYLIGQFAETPNTKRQFIDALHEALLPLPLPDAESAEENASAATTSRIVVKTVVLADGSYGTQNVLVDEDVKAFGIRQCIMKNQCANLLSIICLAVCKVMLRKDTEPIPPETTSSVYHKALLIIASLYKYSKENTSLGNHSSVRMRVEKCLRVLCRCYQSNTRVTEASGAYDFLDAVVGQREITEGEENQKIYNANVRTKCGVCDEINFFPSFDGLDSLAPSVNSQAAILGSKKPAESKVFSSVDGIPLSGMSDSIYVEAYVRMNHLDVIIELYLVNNLPEALTNVSVSVSTHGDSMRILESSPDSIMLSSNGGTGTISSTIRLTSTDAGLIFGFCTFDRGVRKSHFPLAELQIDLLDCLEESYIGSSSFRRLWSVFEWENKIPISLTLKRQTGENRLPSNKYSSEKCLQLIKLLLERTKMKITAENESMLSDSDLKTMSENGILAINFCTRSIFDEEALVNLSLDLLKPGRIAGIARIRAKTQGIALSLGDRVAQTQREFAAL